MPPVPPGRGMALAKSCTMDPAQATSQKSTWMFKACSTNQGEQKRQNCCRTDTASMPSMTHPCLTAALKVVEN